MRIWFVLVAIISLVGAGEFRVEKSKKFSEEMAPTLLSTSFSVALSSRSDKKIQKTFNSIIEDAKEEKICKGGQYRIYPKYRWDNHKRYFDEYQGRVSFNCKFRDSRRLDAVLDKIDRRDVKVSLSPIRWELTKSQKFKLKRTLERKALKYAKNEAEFLSEELSTSCRIDNINFTRMSSKHVRPILYNVATASSDSAKSTAPIEENQKINMSVLYRFVCGN